MDKMIQNRNSLIAYLESHAPQPCIRRAASEGVVENLGMFSNVLNGHFGWVVKITSKHKKVWYVATINHYLMKEPKPFVISEPAWKNWVGWLNSDIKLHLGDNPEEYRRLMDATKT